MSLDSQIQHVMLFKASLISIKLLRALPESVLLHAVPAVESASLRVETGHLEGEFGWDGRGLGWIAEIRRATTGWGKGG